MRLLVTGSRHWTDERSVCREIEALAPSVVIHGGAHGADAIAAGYAASHGIRLLPFSADWDAHGKSAGPRRNARMLAEGKPDKGLAFGPLWWLWTRENSFGVVAARWERTGTGDMARRLLDAGIPTRWIATPDARAVDLIRFPAEGVLRPCHDEPHVWTATATVPVYCTRCGASMVSVRATAA